MFSLSRGERLFLTLLLLYSLVPVLGGLLRLADLTFGMPALPPNGRAVASPTPIVLHILGSVVFCVIGALQFLPGIRRANINLHRRLGRVVALAGLLSAMTGLWMTLVFEFPVGLQGDLLYWVRIGVSLAMAGFIVWAIISVRGGALADHRAHMIRAYAIAQGASTQAVLGIGWMLLFGTELSGPLRDVVMVSAWGINLLAAELLIIPTQKPSAPNARVLKMEDR